ncbi:ceramide glucosyltransferase-like isoform X2 [Ptychodera flava]|uniref:ceramide glucosyltransferase-like isoform X2 n=1 Tax=Ptychodera flava TaxID=63121 RepID=UPI003969D1FF
MALMAMDDALAIFLTVLAVIVLVLDFILLCLHFLSIIYCRIHCNRKPVGLVREELPGVSILKPLVGVDPNFAENLETFFTLDYPKYELLLCVHEECDPAISIIKPLMEKYPNVDSQLFIGGERVGINPKVNNMNQGYKCSKYDLIMVSDAGCHANNDTLYDLVSHMTETVGVVHQMPYVLPRKGFASIVEMVYFGGAHARMYLGANAIGINCVTGMSSMMRKSILEDAGGMSELGKYIAEDYFMGKACWDRGFTVKVTSLFAMQNSGTYSLKRFKSRMARWCKLRLATVPPLVIFEPLTECLALGACTAWAVYFLFHVHPLVFFLCHSLVWFILDYIQLLGVQNGPLPFNKFEYTVAWITREVLAILAFIEALFDPNIKWRTGTFRLKWGGQVMEVKDEDASKGCRCYLV